MRSLTKRSGLVGDLVSGTAGLIMAIVVAMVLITTVLGAGLLTGTDSTVANSTQANFTTGIQNVATKIPTILLIAAIVLLFGVLAILVLRAKSMGLGGSGSGSL